MRQSTKPLPSCSSSEDLALSPGVTIVVAPREKYSASLRTLEALYRNTRVPFELVYVDGNSPAGIAEAIRRNAQALGFKLLRVNRTLSPNEARNIGFAEVQTEFVVFIDNDSEPAPGWLEALLACARETGAWAVAPLYLEGEPADEVIHMACGSCHISEHDGVRHFESAHNHAHRHCSEVPEVLQRSETELFEFHCVLIRTRVMHALGRLDEQLLSAHEHEDLALQIHAAGGKIYMEPAARVTYLLGLLDPHDIEYAAQRWSEDWNTRSARHFVGKWRLQQNVADNSIAWGRQHRLGLMRAKRTPLSILRAAAKRAVVAMLGRGRYERLRQSA